MYDTTISLTLPENEIMFVRFLLIVINCYYQSMFLNYEYMLLFSVFRLCFEHPGQSSTHYRNQQFWQNLTKRLNPQQTLEELVSPVKTFSYFIQAWQTTTQKCLQKYVFLPSMNQLNIY